MLNQISEFSHFFRTFRIFSQFVEWRSATSTQATKHNLLAHHSLPPPAPGTFFSLRIKQIFVLWSMRPKATENWLWSVPFPASFDGREGLPSRAFLLLKKRERQPVLAAPAIISGVFAACERSSAARTCLFWAPNGALRALHPLQLLIHPPKIKQ